MGDTTIRVSDELADELYDRKERGESYEDVIWRLLGTEASENADSGLSTGERSQPEPTPDLEGRETGVSGFMERVEFPSTKDRAACVEAVQAAHDYIEREGTATMREFVREVMPEHPIGYTVPDLEPGERYRGAWWRKVVKPGLEALPDVESPPTGGSEWKHVDAE